MDAGESMVIKCIVTDGNPTFLNYFFWEFEPKYASTQSQALPFQRERREIHIDAVVYSDAGRYICTAGNSVSRDTAQTDITVNCKLP